MGVGVTQSNASRTGLVVDLEWRLTLFTLTMLPVLVVLGFWQLDRAEEKAALVAEYEARKDLPPIDINAFQGLPGEARGERQIHFRGDVLPGHYLLLDNRTRRGRFGYEVVAFVDTNQVIVPLNLGWVEGDPARRRLPEVSLPKGTIDWLGRAHTPTANAFVLADEAFPALCRGSSGTFLARWSDITARQQRPATTSGSSYRSQFARRVGGRLGCC